MIRSSFRQFMSGARSSWGLYLANLRPAILFGSTIPRILFQALFFIFLGQSAGGHELAVFALIGNAVQTSAHFGIVFMTGVIEGEKWSGTLPFIIAAPTNWLPSMLGRSVATYVHAIFNSMMILLVFVPIFAPEIMMMDILRAAPLYFLVLASLSTLGWLVGAIALPVRWGTMIANMVVYTMMVLCGVNIPLDALPIPAQIAGQLIPMTNGLLAIRGVIAGGSYVSVLPLIGKEILVGLIYGAVAWGAFQYRLRVTRETGAFDLM